MTRDEIRDEIRAHAKECGLDEQTAEFSLAFLESIPRVKQPAAQLLRFCEDMGWCDCQILEFMDYARAMIHARKYEGDDEKREARLNSSTFIAEGYTAAIVAAQGRAQGALN